MKILTQSPIRNVWRLTIIVWLVYVAISLLSGIVAISPIGPTEKLFGMNLGEPSIFEGYVSAFIAVVITFLILALALPAILLWEFVKDRFWPQPSTPIIYKKNRSNNL